MSLPTNLRDDILDSEVNTHRRYNVKSHVDDSTIMANVYLEDISTYTQQGDEVTASMVNESNTKINGLTLSIESMEVVDALPSVGVEGRLYFSKS